MFQPVYFDSISISSHSFVTHPHSHPHSHSSHCMTWKLALLDGVKYQTCKQKIAIYCSERISSRLLLCFQQAKTPKIQSHTKTMETISSHCIYYNNVSLLVREFCGWTSFSFVTIRCVLPFSTIIVFHKQISEKPKHHRRQRVSTWNFSRNERLDFPKTLKGILNTLLSTDKM